MGSHLCLRLLGAPVVTNWRNIALINLGLWGPPLLWATALQLGQVLPYMDCARGSHSLSMVAIAGLALVILAGLLVWRVAGRGRREFSFLAALSALSSVVFAFALALQTAATWILTGCER
jgi:hypothetical protein